MKNTIDTILKVILSLIIVIPILGQAGVFPAPTAEMYNNAEAYAFIKMLMDGGYVMYIMSVVLMLAIYFIWTKRAPLAMLLILPITVNVVAFHAVLDGGLFTGGAMLGNVMAAINLYFLWQYRNNYRSLWVLEK